MTLNDKNSSRSHILLHYVKAIPLWSFSVRRERICRRKTLSTSLGTHVPHDEGCFLFFFLSFSRLNFYLSFFSNQRPLFVTTRNLCLCFCRDLRLKFIPRHTSPLSGESRDTGHAKHTNANRKDKSSKRMTFVPKGSPL